jgi:hypothetical protein
VALFDTYDYICSFATRQPLDTKVARGVVGCYLHFTLHRSPSIRIFDHEFSDLIPEHIPPTGYGNSLPLRGGIRRGANRPNCVRKQTIVLGTELSTRAQPFNPKSTRKRHPCLLSQVCVPRLLPSHIVTAEIGANVSNIPSVTLLSPRNLQHFRS